MKFSPLYLVSGAYISGIVIAARFHPAPWVPGIFTGLAIFLALFRAPNLFFRSGESSFGMVWDGLATGLVQRARSLRAVALLTVFFGLGALFTSCRIQPPPELERVLGVFSPGVPREILGVVVQPPEGNGGKLYLVIKVLNVQKPGGTVILAPARHPPKMGLIRLTVPSSGFTRRRVDYGDRIRFRAVLRRPPDAENPGEPSLRRSLAREGIYSVAYLDDPGQLQVLGDFTPSWLIRLAVHLKKRVEGVFDQTLPPVAAGVLKALVFGDREGLPERLAEDFRDAGVVHILSVSGLHLGFVAMLLMAAGKILRLKGLLAVLAAATGVAGYALLTGWQPPAVRAAIMWMAGIGATISGRERAGLPALTLAAVGILFANPLALFDVGFQLSFAATWGIVALAPGLWRSGRDGAAAGGGGGGFNGFSGFRELSRWFLHVLRASMAVSAAAQLATLPLSAFYFNRFSAVALLANLFLAPLSGVIVQVGLAAGVAGLIWLPLAGLWQAANVVFILGFVKLAAFFGKMPGSVLDVATPSAWLCIFYYAGLVYLVRSLQPVTAPWQSRRIRQGVLLATLGLAAVVPWMGVWRVASPWLRVTFLNVGQGDAIHLQLPGGFQLMVDGGGRPGASGAGGADIGERTVLPYLRRLGVRRLDMIFITHRHADHVRGLIRVMEAMPVKELVEGERELKYQGEDDSGYEQLLAAAKKRGVHIRAVTAGGTFLFGKRSRLEILSPGPTGQVWNAGENDLSLVMRLSYRRFSLLLTGDRELSKGSVPGNRADLSATVLKVPHHGSREALGRGFLTRIHPKAAVISVGRNNYGHPAEDTIRLLETEKVRLYRTDLNGAVVVETDGRRYRIRTRHETPD
ncbi:MAG: DNA internalization-related competence protein ComEC/Rec2 [Firmicutes bacterium]|nr:DNA internalization-related competence protein ComEC/Rec2 [Bacillota bacterium]